MARATILIRWAMAIAVCLSLEVRAQDPAPSGGGLDVINAKKPGESTEEGFVSKKTGKSFAKSHIEEITNENFPDLIESFDYPNADISDLVKAISELTGKNFIVDPNVHGKITVIAPSRITVAEAYKAFLSALAINGLAVVPGDGFYKIKQARAAQRDNIETYGGAYYPSSDQMITRIVKLKYISADEINKQLRLITSNQGEIFPYTPTNSLIISDYGANIDRVMKILAQLDVPGFEERMEVIRVRYARAKDLQELIDKIINKGESSNSGFPGGIPRFRRPGEGTGSTSGAEVYSVVVADERTNSIIVVGNQAGIEKIRHLVARLDFRLRPDEAGGVFVYYVRNHEAEAIANTLNNIATESKKAQDQGAKGGAPGAPSAAPVGPPATAIFGGDVKIAADKITNSLIITASKQDYEVLKNILAKIDIPRDQVYIKAYILEMQVQRDDNWEIDYYKFAPGGVGRIGFRGNSSFQDLIDPTNDKGGVFGFGGGGNVTLTTLGGMMGGMAGGYGGGYGGYGGGYGGYPGYGGVGGIGTPGMMPGIGTGQFGIQVPSVDGLIKFLTTNTSTNVISTPQLMAINNEEASIEVGDKVPVSTSTSPGVAGTPPIMSTQRENISTKLTITPYLSPDNDRVKMKVKQEVADIDQSVPIGAAALAQTAIATSTRNITTQLVVDNGDTAVLGGLMKDKDSVTESKIPVLGDIPIIGWLFKAKETTKQKTNLLVFITPKIVRGAEDNAAIVNQKINDRIDFIQRSMGGRDPLGRYIDDIPRRTAYKPTQESAPAAPPPDENKMNLDNNVEPNSPDKDNSSQPAQPNQEEPAIETF